MSRILKDYGLPVLASLLVSISRIPLYLGFLVFLGFIPLLMYFAQEERSFRKLFGAALLYALVQIGIVFYWIGSVTLPGLVGIWLIYAVYYAVSFYIVQRVWYRLPAWRYVAFACVYVSFEYLQNFTEMRFPWFNIGYSLADYLPLIQVADLGGMALLALLILSINILIYHAFKTRKRYLLHAAILLVVWLGYGFYALKSIKLEEHEARIAVMQPSIPQVDKWEAEHYEYIISRYDSLCAEAMHQGTKMLIFPEAAMPVYLMLEPGPMADLRTLLSKYGLSVFTGFPHSTIAPSGHSQQYLYYNAATLFNPDQGFGELYYKNILVPIGERMLWLDQFPFLWSLQFGQANWEFGTKIPVYECDGYKFSPSICYELAFPHFMQKANFHQEATPKVDYHVNITNDAWFGTSYGPWLHGMMTRFRAVESRIQVYRSANTGISMIVDPLGRILARAELFEIKNISTPLYTTNKIPLYSRITYYPWLFVLATAILLIVALLRGRRRL